MSFRQKILGCYVAIFLLFIALLFPLGTYVVKAIVIKTMRDRVETLTDTIRTAPNHEALIRALKDQKPSIFFRVGLITDQKKILYDSQIKRLLPVEFSQDYVVSHPEVDRAFDLGIGYEEADSKLLGMRFFYLAKAFDFHGKTYILRAGFPYKNMEALSRDFRFGFLTLGAALLLFFGLITLFVVQRFTAPIQQIILAVKPYQEGKEEALPEISLKTNDREINKLAHTFNALTSKVRKQIQALVFEKNEKTTLLASLEEGVIAIDAEGKVSYGNPMACELLEKEILVGDSAEELLPQKWSGLAKKALEKKSPESATDACFVRGRQRFFDLIATPLKEEKGVVIVLQDKTQSHLLSEMRKDFVANASHELKTPLTVIRGFSETLHDNPDLPETMRSEILMRVVNNCERMTRLIKDLLMLADLENSEEKKWHLCDFTLLAKKCRTHLLEAYPDAVIEIHASEDAKTFCLPSLMEQALMNLLENGAKYSSLKPHLTINIEKGESALTLSVQDLGMGIEEASLASIFNRFYTVNKAHSKKLGGSGLGLSIVRQIVEKHKGKISVHSTVGQGSLFTLTIPRIKVV